MAAITLIIYLNLEIVKVNIQKEEPRRAVEGRRSGWMYHHHRIRSTSLRSPYPRLSPITSPGLLSCCAFSEIDRDHEVAPAPYIPVVMSGVRHYLDSVFSIVLRQTIMCKISYFVVTPRISRRSEHVSPSWYWRWQEEHTSVEHDGHR